MCAHFCYKILHCGTTVNASWDLWDGSIMITSWHGNAFRITGPWWGFLISLKKLFNKQSRFRRFETPQPSGDMHCNDVVCYRPNNVWTNALYGNDIGASLVLSSENNTKFVYLINAAKLKNRTEMSHVNKSWTEMSNVYEVWTKLFAVFPDFKQCNIS